MKNIKHTLVAFAALAVSSVFAQDCGTLQDLGFPETACPGDNKIYPLKNGGINYSQTDAIYLLGETPGDWVYDASKMRYTADMKVNGEYIIYAGVIDNCRNILVDMTLPLECIDGCTDEVASNYEESANNDDGTCIYTTNEVVSASTDLQVVGTVATDGVAGRIESWKLDGPTLTVDWKVFVGDEEPFLVTRTYEVSSTEGVVIVELVVNFDSNSSPSVAARSASNSVTLRKGVDLGRVTGVSGNLAEELAIYPTPVENSLFIDGVDNIQSVSIFNELGQEVLTEQNTTNINTSELEKGTYIINIQTDGSAVSKKFIK